MLPLWHLVIVVVIASKKQQRDTLPIIPQEKNVCGYTTHCKLETSIPDATSIPDQYSQAEPCLKGDRRNCHLWGLTWLQRIDYTFQIEYLLMSGNKAQYLPL